MSYKDFKSNFNVLAEMFTSRFQTGGVSVGDFCKIRKDALKNEFIKGKPSQFVDKINEIINSKLLLKIASVKSSKTDAPNEQGTTIVDKIFVDVVQEYAPGLWKEPITLPLEAIDIVTPEGNNWSPEIPKELIKKNPTQIKPKEVKDQKLANSDTKNSFAKEPKDGRDTTKVKESLTLEEAYSHIN